MTGILGFMGWARKKDIFFGGFFTVIFSSAHSLLFLKDPFYNNAKYILINWIILFIGLYISNSVNNYSANQSRTLRKMLIKSRSDKRNLREEREKSEKLLLNILPVEVANELKRKGSTEPVYYSSVTIIFTDFKGFTQVAENLSPNDLIGELDKCFSYFDSLMDRYNLEKLKTIGDSYMCAGGIPVPNHTHPVDAVLASLEIQHFMNQMKFIKEEQKFPYWELRLGIHTGPLVAGVIGEKKFAYDIWGDTVNTASRMESSGVPGKINISHTVYELVKDFFICEYRGKVTAKNKGQIDMYFVCAIKPELSVDREGRVPNEKFKAKLLEFF